MNTLSIPGGITVHQGDALTVLRTVPSESVHCVVTSPAYYGLRDYGTSQWEGGDPSCDHRAANEHRQLPHGDGRAYDSYAAQRVAIAGAGALFRAVCGKCGALRVDQQIGLEETPDEYITRLVEVFREVWRVLRKDGTLWLNIGDSYANDGKWGGSTGGKHVPALHDSCVGRGRRQTGLKPKDLCMIPARVAIALQAWGWYLRSDIIWAKKAPMPESVTDRPTSAHEHIFLLAKQEKYFYDADAVRESSSWGRQNNPDWQRQRAITNAKKGAGNRNAADGGFTAWSPEQGRNLRNVWHLSPEPCAEAHFATFPTEIPRRAILAGTSQMGCCPACGAPYRRVVEKTLGTPDSFNGSSFNKGKTHEARAALSAVGQQERTLATKTVGWEPPCLCGSTADDVQPGDLDIIDTPTGERIADDPSLHTGRAGMNRPRGDNEGRRPITRYEQRKYAAQLRRSPQRSAMEEEAGVAFAHYIRTDRSGARPIPPELLDAWLERGWLTKVEPPEIHPLPPVPCRVLDPFCGSGTTLLVARQLGRHAVGIELNESYISIIKNRCNADQLSIFDAADEQREPQE